MPAVARAEDAGRTDAEPPSGALAGRAASLLNIVVLRDATEVEADPEEEDGARPVQALEHGSLRVKRSPLRPPVVDARADARRYRAAVERLRPLEVARDRQPD